MKKQSSYQKMKARKDAYIQQLHKDIFILVEDEDLQAILAVRMKWKIYLSLERSMWMGVHEHPIKFDGFRK